MLMRCHFSTAATPSQVHRAYTDFSPRRLKTWRDTLRPGNFSLLDEGEGWAVVREGSLAMGVVLRYEWDTSYAVRWSVVESSFCDRGKGRMEVEALARGSRVHIIIEEHGGRGIRGKLILVVKGLLGPLVLTRSARRSLDRLATEEPSAHDE
jgi:hypothetical protein